MYDAYTRLTEFRRDHPAVVIDRDDFGKWQARIPPQSGERFTGTFLGGRDELRSLLDDLDEIVDPGDPMSSGLACKHPRGGLPVSPSPPVTRQ